MLVISRRSGERIIIDGVIEISILKFSGTKVVLGVAAPREIAVSRAEILKKPQANELSTVRVKRSEQR